MDTCIMLVMEHKSDWPLETLGCVEQCIALHQEPQETRGELLMRTYDRLAIIERKGIGVQAGILSCNDDGSQRALEGRVPLARALLARVLRSGGQRLDLVARQSAPERIRHSLIALAGTLTEGLGGTSVSVTACFTRGQAPENRGISQDARTICIIGAAFAQ